MGPNYNFMGHGYSGGNFAPISNKIVVKSLEDALRRYADFNSEMLYVDANQNLLYNIYTDVRGEKTYDIFEVKKREPVDVKNNNDAIMEKLNELSVKVEELYGKRNVEQTGSKQ